MNSNYQENIKNLKPIHASQIKELSEDTFVYFGRETCWYCVDFAEEFPEIDVEIYYVDTTNTFMDEKLQKVREEYDVRTVPALIFRQTNGSFKKLNRDVRESIREFIAALSEVV